MRVLYEKRSERLKRKGYWAKLFSSKLTWRRRAWGEVKDGICMISGELRKYTIHHFAKRKEYYSKLHHEYPFVDVVVEYYKPNSETLEIGCGVGFFLDHMLSYSPRSLVGIDICKALIYEASKKFNKIDFLVGDAEELPIKSQCFKTVFVRNLLHHLVGETPNLSERNFL